MFNKLLEKPFKLFSAAGCLYVLVNIVINIFTGFTYRNSMYPFADILTFSLEGISLILFILTFFFYTKHFLYYISLEILIFTNLYDSNIYVALFLSSILLVILLTENRKTTTKQIVIYTVIEFVKLALVIPYGPSEFFYYVGLTLFALCTIGCINLLFHHAYSKNSTASINLDDYKLSARQKECIKEIVLNNTTIKALAITYNVSESAIKKDLTYIYDTLGITGKADLKALFIGYKF